MKKINESTVAMVLAMVVGFIAIVIFLTTTFNNQEQTQHHKFLELQEILLENQIEMRDSLIKSTQQEVDSLREQLLLYNPETIWLARGIYSETNHPIEMYPVAWVIRNRYDVNYNGCQTYKCVILDPLQFSAFNWNNTSRLYYRNKSITDEGQTWTTALTVAAEVIDADTTERPFDRLTLNFYSPVSMSPQYSVPKWVTNEVEYVEMENINDDRFKFYRIVSSELIKELTRE